MPLSHPITLYDSSSSPELKHPCLTVFVRFSNQETFKLNQSGKSPLFSQDWDFQKVLSVGHGNKTKESPQKRYQPTQITAVHVMKSWRKSTQKRLSNFGSAGLCFWCPFRRRFRGLGEMEGDEPRGCHAKVVSKHDSSWTLEDINNHKHV